MSDDYCELCDLPRSTCVHGMPTPPPAPPTPARPQASPSTRRTATRATRTSTPAAPVRRTPRKWTPPEALSPHIVHVLLEAGGGLDADEVFERLETQLADVLLEGDRGTTPEGELRWRYAARRARQALIGSGTMVKGEPGRWQLADEVIAAG